MYCSGGVRMPDEFEEAERVEAQDLIDGVEGMEDRFDGNGGGFKFRCKFACALSAVELFARLGCGMDI